MRVGLLTMLLAIAAVTLPVSAQALQDSYHLNIPRQPLDGALKDLAQQTGLQIARFTDTPGGSALVGPVRGDLSVGQALNSLLVNSGLTYKMVNDRTIAVMIPGAALAPAAAALSSGAAQASPTAAGDSQKEGKNNSSDTFRLAQASTAQATSAASVNNPQLSQKPPAYLEEVVVTAQKVPQRLQDVPVPVTAISAETLLANNELRLQDYYNQVPGFSVAPATLGSLQILAVRGITAGNAGNPSVGITVDDVPYGSSTGIGGGFVVPDIDPGDLARIELLRGPQGTLYGASSIGGLLKFVTLDPSTNNVSGRLEAGASQVFHGEELGYNVRGSVNVPISDAWALRASGFARRDPGYIDNVQTGETGVNRADYYGGRLATMWRPSETFSLKLSALFQEGRAYGSANVNLPINGYQGPPLGDLQHSELYGTGGYERKVQAYSAIVDTKLGTADFTSVTGYNINTFTDVLDYTPFLGACCTLPAFGVTGTPIRENSKTSKFTQEFRLTMPLGARLDWLLGAFYTHEDSQYVQITRAFDATTLQFVTPPDYLNFPTTYAEYAAFTDFTLHFTDQFDVQLGGRGSEIRQSVVETEEGPFVPILQPGQVSPFALPEAHSKSNSFTYLVTPRLRISSDLMMYARFASGYRPGGPNPVPGVPRQYDPDRTQDYDLGIKGDFIDHKLSIDASLYYIHWKDIQLGLYTPSFQSYTGNAGAAKSEGVELAVHAKPLSGLNIASWIAWNEAVLTEGFPNTGNILGEPGDRLPYASRWSGNLSVEQTFPLWSGTSGFVGGMASYVGDRQGEFVYVLPRQTLGSYTEVNLNGGIAWESWRLNLFVNNVADERGALAGGLGSFPPYAFTYIQPRTVGFSVVKTF